MLSFATCHYVDVEAGVMITASHNPKEYNGMKSLAHSGEPYNLKKYGPEMVKIMYTMVEKDIVRHTVIPKQNPPVLTDIPPSQGGLEQRDVLEEWIDHILAFIGKGVNFSKYTIVADGGSGVA